MTFKRVIRESAEHEALTRGRQSLPGRLLGALVHVPLTALMIAELGAILIGAAAVFFLLPA
jgi:hypothetical protein